MRKTTCQLISGVKAFKGKGAFRDALFTSENFLQQIHNEIELLSGESRSIEKRSFYLEVHKAPTATCYRAWKLRWRLGGDRNGHTHWEGIAPRMERLSIAERRYYEGLNERMRELNVLEIMVRTQAKWLREHLDNIGEAIPGGGQALTKLNQVQKQQPSFY